VRDGMGDMIVAHVSETPERMTTLVPGLMPAIEWLVDAMLAKSPADRPQSMEVVSLEVRRCLEGLGVRLTPAEVRPRQRVMVPPVAGGSDTATLTPQQLSGRGSGGNEATPPPEPKTKTKSVPSAGGTRLLSDEMQASFDSPSGRRRRTTLRSATGERASTTPPAGRSSWVRSGILLAVAAGIGGVAVAFALRQPDASRSTSASTSGTAKAADPASGTAAQQPPEKVTIDVRGLPAEAEVFFDGAPVLELPLRVARDERRHALVIRAKGYDEREVEVDARRDRVVDLVMAPAAKPAAGETHETARRPGAHDKANGAARTRDHRRPNNDGRDREAITDI